MRKVLLISLFLSVFAVAKTVSLSINVPESVVLDPGDIIQIDSFPMQWGPSRIVLGFQSQGNRTLEGFVLNGECRRSLFGYYQQVDFEFDGNAVYLTYLGNTSTNVNLQWWLDYSVVQSQCEEPSATGLMNLGNLLGPVYSAYTDLGPINSISSFETSSQMLKISDYPTWPNNTIMIQIEPEDGKPLDGYVYVGKETLKISGYSVTIPLSRRSFLPTRFQVSMSTRRKFHVTWWAAYRNAQDIPVQLRVIPGENPDSISCEYSFTGPNTRRVLLKYSTSDFVDGNPPTYTEKTTLEGAALGLASNSFHVGTVYDIDAHVADGKEITIAIPLNAPRSIDVSEVSVYHEKNGIVERIVPDSIVDGFVYFRTSSFSSFWTSVGNFFVEIGEAICDIRGVIVDGVKYVVEKLEDFRNMVVNGVCNLFDLDAWINLFTKDLDETSTENWDLPEGEMPRSEYKDSYNPSLFDIIEVAASLQLTQITNNMSDSSRLETTKNNLDIMLAELINRKMNGIGKKRFDVEGLANLVVDSVSAPVSDYLAVSTVFTHYAYEMVKMLNELYGALNANVIRTYFEETKKLVTGHSSVEQVCRNLLGGFGVFDYEVDLFNFGADGLKFLLQHGSSDVDSVLVIKDKRDDLILKTTDVLARVALLAYYDKSMRKSLRMWFNQTYKSLSVMIEMMGPLMLYNNITIKAEAAMALYEYVYWGTTTHFEKFKIGIETHYGEKGGYSEGTGYLQYINEDVPYLMVALKKAFAQTGENFELPQKFYESGYFLKEMSRNVLWDVATHSSIRIPIEIDDGCTYTPEYSVWGTLTGDDIFFKMARNYPIDVQYKYVDYYNTNVSQGGYNLPDSIIKLYYYNGFIENSKKLYGNPLAGSPLVALGYAADWNDSYLETLEESFGVIGTVADGGAIINYRDENGEDYTITVVAENGDLWKNGQAHDQQDNMSFTLSSTRDGHIVRDLGYSGFGIYKEAHRYLDHNVLMRPDSPIYTDGRGNEYLSYEELGRRAENYTGEYTGYGTFGLFGLISSSLADYGAAGAGGSEAFLVDSLKKEGLLAYTFHQQTKGYEDSVLHVSSFENYRSIAYFGKTLWLFDQPSDDSLLWVVNGSSQRSELQGSFFDEKTDVYVGKYLASALGLQEVSTSQHSLRADVPLGVIWTHRQKINLNDYRNDGQNGFAPPVTMLYPIDLTHRFGWTNSCNASNVQCFERIEGNVKQRVVVPARGASYKLSEVLTDVEEGDKSSYNGILFAERVGNGDWTVLGALNNGNKVNKLIVKVKYLPSNLLLRIF